MTLYTKPEGTITPEDFSLKLDSMLADEGPFEPEPLADLNLLAMKRGPLQFALQTTLQRTLLKRTITHATVAVPYYRNRRNSYCHSESSDNRDHHFVPLNQLPILRRQDLYDHGPEMLAENANLQMISHTSGSTGEPVLIHRSHEEIRFLHRYYLRLFEPVQDMLARRPLCLTFPNQYHGTPVPLPSLGLPLASGVTDDTLLRDAARVLSKDYELSGFDKRISLLSGLSHHIVLFTASLVEAGLNPAEFALLGVSVTGGYISQYWLNWLRDVWRCPVTDRWSMTEATGGATRDPGTGLFEFDPHIVIEIVNPVSGKAIEGDGTGELLITNLHPFVQMQPLIRYGSGDLVHRQMQEGGNMPVFDFLGKLKNCIVDHSGPEFHCLVSSARVFDLLSSWPDVDCVDFFPNISVVRDRLVGSMPRFSLEAATQDGHTSIELKVQLKWNPDAFPARARFLQNEAEHSLLNAPNTTLQDRVNAGHASLTVRLVGPQSLAGPPLIKI